MSFDKRRAKSVGKPSDVVPIAVVALVRRGQNEPPRVLLTRRADDVHLAGFRELPGGRIEAGETAAEAARREVREELDADVDRLVPLITVTHVYPERTVELHAFVGTLAGAPPRPHDWVSVDDLDEAGLPPANAPITRALRAHLG